MRKFLALVGLLAMMAAPYGETIHDHSLGHSHDDCPACQVKSNPGVGVHVVIDTVCTLAYHAGPLSPQSHPQAFSDPLHVAPKNSPPASAA